MRTPTRLAAYAAGLAVLFGASFAIAGAVVDEDTAASWRDTAAEDHDDGHDNGGDDTGYGDGGHDNGGDDTGHGDNGGDGHDHGDDAQVEGDHGDEDGASGVAVAADGYRISDVSAPQTPRERGTLEFTVSGPDGQPVTDYAVSHEKRMHLIVVRSDGAGYRHVHPTLAGAGTWTVPWTWQHAGNYRIYADFVPAATGDEVTVTHTVDVAGQVRTQQQHDDVTTAQVDDFDVSVTGDLVAGEESELTFTVQRDGRPVTDLQPYLGAYGHLVALRSGDLAYLHVHPAGHPGDGSTDPGPRIEFAASAPTPGQYLLYLDFQVGDTVHTAEFTVTAR